MTDREKEGMRLMLDKTWHGDCRRRPVHKAKYSPRQLIHASNRQSVFITTQKAGRKESIDRMKLSYLDAYVVPMILQ